MRKCCVIVTIAALNDAQLGNVGSDLVVILARAEAHYRNGTVAMAERMRIEVLGCDGGIGGALRTCALLVNDNVLMDAGTGLGDLPLSTLTGIDHVFVTHAHVDHIAHLPLLIDVAMARRASPVTVHASDETLRTLESHIFNWSIWPDFTQLPSPERPSMRYSQVEVGQAVDLGNCQITPVPAEHTIPTVGFHLANGNASLVYCGDTTVCDPLWPTVNAIDNLKYLIIETAFDDAKLQLAKRAGHLSPMLLAAELEKFQSPADVYIDHIKPGLEETVMHEIARQVRNRCPRALKRGQLLEL